MKVAGRDAGVKLRSRLQLAERQSPTHDGRTTARGCLPAGRSPAALRTPQDEMMMSLIVTLR